MSESRERRVAQLEREQRAYRRQVLLDRLEEIRRTALWLADLRADRPSVFRPYGLGWSRYK